MEGVAEAEDSVLVIEDVAGEHRALERALGARGHNVLACTRAKARKLLESESADVVIVGLQDVRAVLDASTVPVVVLSGAAGADERAELLSAGASACVPDPLDPVELEGYIQVAMRFRRLERLSLTDPLTGLGNRREAERELARVIAGASRHGHPLGLVLVDVDGFKAVNDTYGHAAGDQVLREVAVRMAGCLRGSDTMARWGGEEFHVILPDTKPLGVGQTGERLRRSVERDPFPIDATTIRLSVSVGWADWRGEDPVEFQLRADRALYDAKAAGRNAVRPVPKS
jgi:two-component system cell cycle response regulator